MPDPRTAELFIFAQQQLCQVSCPGPRASQRGQLAQSRGKHSGEEALIFGRVKLSCCRVGKPAVNDAAGRATKGGQITGERNPEFGLPQGLTELGDNLRGSVIQTIEDAQ